MAVGPRVTIDEDADSPLTAFQRLMTFWPILVMMLAGMTASLTFMAWWIRDDADKNNRVANLATAVLQVQEDRATLIQLQNAVNLMNRDVLELKNYRAAAENRGQVLRSEVSTIQSENSGTRTLLTAIQASVDRLSDAVNAQNDRLNQFIDNREGK